ncbi:arsenate reductase ArsC [Yinghuangia aomiensis]|uniref:arsenate reductase ArsC n=1 Tax=Yinghuangia aomiensis TaxID=676205 RepID=UPI0031ECAD36
MVQAMAGVGIGLSGKTPEQLTGETIGESDVVGTTSSAQACLVLPVQRHDDWLSEDITGKDLDGVHAIRDAIRARVERLVADLVPRPGDDEQ